MELSFTAWRKKPAATSGLFDLPTDRVLRPNQPPRRVPAEPLVLPGPGTPAPPVQPVVVVNNNNQKQVVKPVTVLTAPREEEEKPLVGGAVARPPPPRPFCTPGVQLITLLGGIFVLWLLFSSPADDSLGGSALCVHKRQKKRPKESWKREGTHLVRTSLEMHVREGLPGDAGGNTGAGMVPGP